MKRAVVAGTLAAVALSPGTAPAATQSVSAQYAQFTPTPVDVLPQAGYSYRQRRTWCPTGTALRQRKAGVAAVTDPDAGPQKS